MKFKKVILRCCWRCSAGAVFGGLRHKGQRQKSGYEQQMSSAMTDEPKNAEEALALHKKLMEQENTILSQNTALWEKVFMAGR